jgi:hypothetical protein
MNRLVTLLALAIGVSGPASAGIINPYAEVINSNVVAGQVSVEGVIERGFGFRVHRDSAGAYLIKFDRRYFPSGCAAMVVSPDAAVFPVVTQSQCGGDFNVSLYDSGGHLTATGFQFIAREDAPQNP